MPCDLYSIVYCLSSPNHIGRVCVRRWSWQKPDINSLHQVNRDSEKQGCPPRPHSQRKNNFSTRIAFCPISNLDLIEDPGSHLSFCRMHFEPDHTDSSQKVTLCKASMHGLVFSYKMALSVSTFLGQACCTLSHCKENLLERTMDLCRVLIFKFILKKNYTKSYLVNHR